MGLLEIIDNFAVITMPADASVLLGGKTAADTLMKSLDWVGIQNWELKD